MGISKILQKRLNVLESLRSPWHNHCDTAAPSCCKIVSVSFPASSTNTHGYSAVYSPPTPSSDVFSLQEGCDAHYGTMEGSSCRHEHLDRCGERDAFLLHAGSDEGKVTLQVIGTAVDTVDSIFNGNTVINKIFSPPFFISYDSRELAAKQGNSIAHIF